MNEWKKIIKKIDQTVNQWIIESINQSINQSSKQSINQSINWSIIHRETEKIDFSHFSPGGGGGNPRDKQDCSEI